MSDESTLSLEGDTHGRIFPYVCVETGRANSGNGGVVYGDVVCEPSYGFAAGGLEHWIMGTCSIITVRLLKRWWFRSNNRDTYRPV